MGCTCFETEKGLQLQCIYIYIIFWWGKALFNTLKRLIINAPRYWWSSCCKQCPRCWHAAIPNVPRMQFLQPNEPSCKTCNHIVRKQKHACWNKKNTNTPWKWCKKSVASKQIHPVVWSTRTYIASEVQFLCLGKMLQTLQTAIANVSENFHLSFSLHFMYFPLSLTRNPFLLKRTFKHGIMLHGSCNVNRHSSNSLFRQLDCSLTVPKINCQSSFSKMLLQPEFAVVVHQQHQPHRPASLSLLHQDRDPPEQPKMVMRQENKRQVEKGLNRIKITRTLWSRSKKKNRGKM